jgi:DNA polymerase III subunit epsilon
VRHLVFDTETTGKADFRAPIQAQHQPHIVQLGAMLVDDSGRVFAELNLIVRPPKGITIPKEASAIHGITDEIASECGVPCTAALWTFQQIVKLADVIVAHNLEFDSLVCEAALARAEMVSALRDKERFCTMHAMTDVCRLPGPYGYKWPKLEEAYRHLFNEWNVKAHDAMEDVRACARIYLHNLKLKAESAVAA